MKKTLAAGEQTLLFLNRRGYAPITLCRACGKGIECPQCSAWLVEHRFRRTLVCHHCGYTEPPAATCKIVRRGRSLRRLRSGRRAAGRGGARRVSRGAGRALHLRLADEPRGGDRRHRAHDRRRDRHPDRHADGGEGPSLPQPDPGRRGRCRSRPQRRRPARRRAHLPAALPGRGPRRPARAAGPRADPDPRARASGDAGAGRQRPRPLRLRRAGRPLRAPACRPMAGWPR